MNMVAKESNKARAVDTVAERPFVAPDVNIYETAEHYVLQAEMPGVTKEHLEVTLEGNTLTFIGRRNEAASKGSLLYRESRAMNFRRIFELDPAIDTEGIVASMEQGILTLTLPKSARVKPRKIEIK
jgi:HSP20 family protein